MHKEHNAKTRREFLARTGIAAAAMTLRTGPTQAASSNKVVGANERIRVGFIGVGNRGSQVLRLFMAEPDCEIAALCDVYRPYTRGKS